MIRHHTFAHDTVAIVVAIASGHPAMIVVVIVASKVITITIEAVVIVDAVVSAGIHIIDAGYSVEEVITVVIVLVDTEHEVRAGIIDGTIEVLPPQESLELAATQDKAQILVAEVEQIVIVVDCVVVAVDHVVENLVDVPEEVVVDLIDIDPLFARKIQLVAHSVRQEARFATNLHGTKHCACIQTDGCQDHHH